MYVKLNLYNSVRLLKNLMLEKYAKETALGIKIKPADC
jgi:hypothetical protein